MIPTAAAVLKEAASHIGFREGRNNDNIFGEFYGANNTAWCAQFVYWCMRKAGADKGQVIPKTAWCPDLLAFARREKLIIRDPVKGDTSGTPAPGDIMLVQRRPGESGYSPNGAKHVGIVEKYLGNGKIQTIEGNTSNNGSAQGNGVYRLIRTLGSNIVIFRPKYAAAVKPKPKQITINGKSYDDIASVSVFYINSAREAGDGFSRHVWYLQLALEREKYWSKPKTGRWSKELQAALDRYRKTKVKINGKLLKGSDAQGKIGMTSLGQLLVNAKIGKRAREGK